MKTIIIHLIFFCPGLLFLDTNICNCQINNLNKHVNKNLGIEIFEKNFNRKIDSCVSFMETKDTLKTQDYIDMVRIFNTLEVRNLINEKESYKEFIGLFTSKYLHLAVIQLESTLTKGMCYYSKKYDLYIGGKPHKNSMYKILEDK